MYKKASDNAQRQASQLWLHDLVFDCEVVLTPEQERQNLVAKLHALEKKICETPKGMRSELGKQKFELQQQISAIRPKLKGPKGVDRCFIDLCSEQLPAWQFRRLMSEASKMAIKESAKVNETCLPNGANCSGTISADCILRD